MVDRLESQLESSLLVAWAGKDPKQPMPTEKHNMDLLTTSRGYEHKTPAPASSPPLALKYFISCPSYIGDKKMAAPFTLSEGSKEE